ncbi:MAG: alpha/beta fold hydrolase [Phenylobacterium sp.]|uniref:alpha/beta hydrolase n=1 Tax=Phenylobacterium sp. TaxID=1871053 RepID=UPI0025E4C11C|nr:alpha/beta hydrolase [Phenylobacterium sp.]MBI1196540.1 alpha/beta fold hydrolase [Phenylobacterium sp.]
MAGPSWASAVERANAEGKQPVLFVHGPWLSARAWAPWAALFEKAGYASLQPAWPDGDDLAARATLGAARRRFTRIVEALNNRPAIVGHSLGALIAQMLAAEGLSAATVAVAPAPFRGAAPLSLPALRAAWPALAAPADARGWVRLSAAQFRYAFANAVSPAEGEALFETYAAPAPRRPVLQAATAGLDPWTEARVDVLAPCRGPLLIVAGGQDHSAPPAVTQAVYDRQKRNRAAASEFVLMSDRGHSLIVDAGWREVADAALGFIQRFA